MHEDIGALALSETPNAHRGGSLADGDQTFNLLMRAVSAEVIRTIEEHRARTRNALLATGSIILAVILSIGGFLINELMDVRINNRVDAFFSERLRDVSFLNQVASLNSDVQTIDRSDGFSEEQAMGAISQVDALYAGFVSEETAGEIPPEERFANGQKLQSAVDTLARNYASAGRTDLVFRLVEAAPSLLESGAVTQTVVQALGRRLVAEPTGAASWTEADGVSRELFENYRRYANRAKETGFPELYLLFELLIRHMESRPERELRELAARIDDLSPTDGDAFRNGITALLTQGWKIAPDSETELVAERTRAFLDAYANASTTLAEIKAQL